MRNTRSPSPDSLVAVTLTGIFSPIATVAGSASRSGLLFSMLIAGIISDPKTPTMTSTETMPVAANSLRRLL